MLKLCDDSVIVAAVSGPAVWNSLPAALRLDMSLSVFRRQLKTFFMTEAADCNS